MEEIWRCFWGLKTWRLWCAVLFGVMLQRSVMPSSSSGKQSRNNILLRLLCPLRWRHHIALKSRKPFTHCPSVASQKTWVLNDSCGDFHVPASMSVFLLQRASGYSNTGPWSRSWTTGIWNCSQGLHLPGQWVQPVYAVCIKLYA